MTLRFEGVKSVRLVYLNMGIIVPITDYKVIEETKKYVDIYFTFPLGERGRFDDIVITDKLGYHHKFSVGQVIKRVKD